jgi:ankyrin repeat protein
MHKYGNNTALMIAAEAGRLDIVRYLMSYGAKVKVKNTVTPAI